MTHFFIHGEDQRHLPAKGHPAFCYFPCQGQQHGTGGLIIQMAALHKAAFRDHRTGVKGDKVTGANAQCLRSLLGPGFLIHHHFQGLIVSRCGGLVAPHVAAGMGGLHRSAVPLAAAGVDDHVFIFNGIVIVAAQLGVPQTAIGLNGAHHGTQRIHMGGDGQGMTRAADAADHRALGRTLRGKAEAGQFCQ